MRQISVRQMENILKNNGFKLIRQSSSHRILSNGEKTISVPCVVLRSVIANRIIKENKFIV